MVAMRCFLKFARPMKVQYAVLLRHNPLQFTFVPILPNISTQNVYSSHSPYSDFARLTIVKDILNARFSGVLKT